MSRFIPSVPFCDNDFYPCEPVALDAMLRFYGYTTPLVFHQRWFFVYQRHGNGDVDVNSRFTSLFHDMRRCGVHVTEHQETDVETAWEHAKSQIDSRKPTPALADTHYLETYYYPGLGHHSGHYVILAGYDAGASTVHVVDPSPSKRFRGDLPLMGFKKAWGSEHIQRCTWMEFQIAEPRWMHTAELAVQMVQQNIRLMLYGKASLRGTFIGLQGLRTLADDLAQWKDLRAYQSRNNLKQLYDQLWSVLMERDGHGVYLKLAAKTLESPMMASVGEDLHTITQKWVVFRNLCLKGHIRYQPEMFEKLYRRLLEIASLEEMALLRLTEIAEIGIGGNLAAPHHPIRLSSLCNLRDA